MEEFWIDVDDLAAYIERQRPDGDDVGRVAESVLVAERLGALGDQLIGHFVERARQAGASWTEIGQNLGISKQAARKRFSGTSFRRSASREGRLLAQFTDRARRVNDRAQREAARARHARVGTEHLVLALLEDPQCRAARAIEFHGTDLVAARAMTGAALRPHDEGLGGPVAFGAEATKAKELALREAKRMRRDQVGTEHLLLGLLREAGKGASLLERFGVTRGNTEAWIAAETGDPDA